MINDHAARLPKEPQDTGSIRRFRCDPCGAALASNLVNRTVQTKPGRTSMRLEPELWGALHEICVREQMPVRDIICRARELAGPGGRTSAVRVYLVQYFSAAATEKGHAESGHVARTAGHGQDLTNEAGVTELAGAENSVLETDGARTVA